MRYEKNIGVFGKEGQKKLRESSVLIAGVGGLGSFVATELVYTGIGEITLVDSDVVEISNLNRQILYTERDIGKKKVDVAVERLRNMNPEVHIKGIYKDIKELDKHADVYIDCLDNWESRTALARLAEKYNRPIIHGAVDSYTGQAGIFFNKNWITSKKGKPVSGNIAPVVGLIGSLQATITIQYLLGNIEEEFLVLVDAKTFEFKKIRVK